MKSRYEQENIAEFLENLSPNNRGDLEEDGETEKGMDLFVCPKREKEKGKKEYDLLEENEDTMRIDERRRDEGQRGRAREVDGWKGALWSRTRK